MELRKYESPLLAVALFLAYIILRIAYIAACCYQKNTENQECFNRKTHPLGINAFCGGIAYLPQQNSKKTVDNVKAAYYNM